MQKIQIFNIILCNDKYRHFTKCTVYMVYLKSIQILQHKIYIKPIELKTYKALHLIGYYYIFYV